MTNCLWITKPISKTINNRLFKNIETLQTKVLFSKDLSLSFHFLQNYQNRCIHIWCTLSSTQIFRGENNLAIFLILSSGVLYISYLILSENCKALVWIPKQRSQQWMSSSTSLSNGLNNNNWAITMNDIHLTNNERKYWIEINLQNTNWKI